MENKCVWKCIPPGSRSKILLRMKLVTFCILFTMVTSAAETYSQKTKFSFNLNGVTIKQVFHEIEDNSEFILLYNERQLDASRKVNVKVTNESIETVLDQILDETQNSYKMYDRQIVILPVVEQKSPVSGSSAMEMQQKKQDVSGVVSDATGVPIPGVSVSVKGTTTGTITDINGQFKMSVPADATLLFSFIGMKAQEVKVGSTTVFNIKMADETIGVEEVVVVGYGIQKKESVVGAISQVGGATLMRSGTSNVTSAISGKLSGVLTMQATGQPGSNDSEVIIRGLSSWNGSKPLALVDGVERDYTDLDPNEIETISVLKDASATAVFGAKGANGVIIVTTKRGKLGKAKLDMSGSFGLQKATRIPDHIDSYTTMNAYNYGLRNQGRFSELVPDQVLNEYLNPSTPINSLRYPNVNWFDVMTKEFAPTTNANFNVSGGTEFIKYFCSLGYVHEGDFFKAKKNGYLDQSHKYDKLNYRANLDFNLTRSTQLTFNVGGDYGVMNQPKTAPWRELYQTTPAKFPAYYPAWALELIPDLDYPDDKGERLAHHLSEYTGNPYSTINQGDFNQYTDSKLFTDLILDQKLDFITKGLSVKGKVALSTYYKIRSLYSDYNLPKYRIDYDKINALGPDGKPLNQNPWVREGQNTEVYILPPVDLNVGALEGGYYSDLYYEGSIGYNRTIGNHTISGLALFNRQQKNTGTEYAYFNESWVGRGTYDFSHKYLFEMNIGYTGSERFAPNNRFGFFPSGAIGWVLSEEHFFKQALPWMSKLKVRYSDGLVGSDSADERWLYQSSYFKDNAGKIKEDKIANSNSQWESARKKNLGVELGFLKNQLTFNVEVFDEFRENMLLTPRTVTFLVGNTFKSLNLGKMKKHGIEIEAEYNKTTTSGLNYNFRGQFGFNENRVVFKDDLPYAPEYKKDAGKPLGAQIGGSLLTGTGYFTSIDDIMNNPSPIAFTGVNVGDYKFLDYSADGTINNMDQFPIKGNLYPPITFSLSSGLSYKNFDFSILLKGNTGKYVDFNQAFENEFTKGTLRIHTSQLDYWTPTNQDAGHSTLHYVGTGDSPYLMWGGGEADRGYGIKIQDRFWRNADYLRIGEIYAGYTIQSEYLNKVAGISNLVVYGSANNVYTFTNLIEGDPERKDFQQGFYPQMMTLKVGLKLGF